MTDYLNKIKNLFKKITTKKISYEKKGVMPAYDWVNILVVSQLVIVIMVAFSFYFYIKINRGDFFGVTIDNTTNETTIDPNLFDKTLNDLNRRAESSDSLSSINIPKDPSL